MDTLWGGDVMCPSGTGRFIADSWFSDEPLPAAYTHPLPRWCGIRWSWQPRESTRRRSKKYLRHVDFLKLLLGGAKKQGNSGTAQVLSDRLPDSLEVMWDLPWRSLAGRSGCHTARSVEASTGEAAEPIQAKAGTVTRVVGSAPVTPVFECGRAAGGSRCMATGRMVRWHPCAHWVQR